MKKFTEQDIIEIFYKKRAFRYKFFFPNIYIDNNESDIITINRNNYVEEFEVKCTKADLLNDFKKLSKHNDLKKGLKLPNRFWIFTPQSVIDEVGVSNIPEYCGILSIGKYNSINIIRNPKRLHDNKISESDILSLASKFVWRYNDLKYLRK